MFTNLARPPLRDNQAGLKFKDFPFRRLWRLIGLVTRIPIARFISFFWLNTASRNWLSANHANYFGGAGTGNCGLGGGSFGSPGIISLMALNGRNGTDNKLGRTKRGSLLGSIKVPVR